MWQFFLKRQQFVLKRSLPNEGFTMMEVLVSILVSTAFVMGTLQALLINATYQVRASREAQATFWIQQDIDLVRARAEVFPEDSTKCNKTTFAGGYGEALRNQIGGTGNIQIAKTDYMGENRKKEYRLVRIITPDNNSPNVLKITYKVGEKDNSTTEKIKADDGKGFKETLAQVYTEVMPGGAFKCST